MLFEVANSGAKDLDAVLELAKRGVAVLAQKATNGSRCVVVIDS